ncbi:hypothetical protein BLA23254_03316 [Burkholderia lata]|uniref:Uncharacterized protein n=1 Tax=Burkholderia lata (strain ATCC 17760 / DSM 23089 / LMG 22485 / NCIMB 9086 / R18194 / 383) TaxID=482957 RepID=A0A6P2LV05_BURL3|nr:hypothetical protein [Burkholderia lata]VWB71009.1 hypothetical protein BLA23254_03316 [Burkholderia lata]
MADTTATVIDLEGYAFWKNVAARLKSENNAMLVTPDVWDEGVIRVTDDDEVARKTDPVIINETRAEVHEWFTRVGFPMPQTWAEYRAGQKYIAELTDALDTVRVGYAHIPQNGVSFIKKQSPRMYEPLVLVLSEGWESVANWHKQQHTFAQIVFEYDESKELPDPAADKFSQ